VQRPSGNSVTDHAHPLVESATPEESGRTYLEQLLAHARVAPESGLARREGDGDVIVGDATEILQHIARALTDVTWRVEGATAADDLVLLQVRIAGTSSARYRNAPPTGRPVTLSVSLTLRVAQSRICGSWCAANDRALCAETSDTP
jgi:hypothetical protein